MTFTYFLIVEHLSVEEREDLDELLVGLNRQRRIRLIAAAGGEIRRG